MTAVTTTPVPAATADGSRFVVDPTRVVHETLDGETVLIHLPSGVYYSLTGWGPAVWALLVAGRTLGETVAQVLARGGNGHDVRALVDDLLAEALLVPGTPAATTDTAGAWGGVSERYVAPALARYDDLQYLLLLDPIHEAADTGWPAQAAAAS